MSSLVTSIANPLWRRVKATATASATTTVDSTPFANIKGLKYIITIFNTTEDKYRYLELTIGKIGAALDDSIFTRLGDTIDIETNVSLSGSDIVLEVVNNETFDLVFDARKLSIR